MKLALLVVAGATATGVGFILLALRLRYAITDRHLKVTLFGLCLRRVRLSDVEHVSKRQTHPAEKWYNTLRPAHRMLVIRRRRGWLKDFIITPKNRYVFKAELERALGNLASGKANQETGKARGAS
jgi:hypothetical protein